MPASIAIRYVARWAGGMGVPTRSVRTVAGIIQTAKPPTDEDEAGDEDYRAAAEPEGQRPERHGQGAAQEERLRRSRSMTRPIPSSPTSSAT